MLDEFPQLGFMAELLSAAATARGFGVRFMPLVCQDLNQLAAAYGREKFSTFISTASCICAFAPRDSFTAETLSKLCGEKIVEATSTGLSDAEGKASANLNQSHQFQKLFRPDQLMAMPRGRMLCLVQYMHPFFVQVPNYWEEEWGRGLAPNPYHSPR
jgi:type IV secretory pathway TraG/TraD family ATPase VirD4